MIGSPSDDDARRRIAAVPYRYHQIEVRPDIVTPGVDRSADTLAQLALPDRCDGMPVFRGVRRDRVIQRCHRRIEKTTPEEAAAVLSARGRLPGDP